MDLELGIETDQGDTTISFWMNEEAQAFQVHLDTEPISINIDPINKILNKDEEVEYVPHEVLDYKIDDSKEGDHDGNAEPGETVDVIVTVKSVGSALSNVTAILHSHDANVVVVDSCAQYGTFAYQENRENQFEPFIIEIDSTTDLHQADFSIEFLIDGYPSDEVFFQIPVYTPKVVFMEGFELLLGKWDLGLGWEPHFWAYEGDYSITDSPLSFYKDSEDNNLTCLRRFNFSGYQNGALEFYHIYLFAEGDSGLVQMRNRVEGWHTIASYDGTIPFEWKRSVVDVSQFCGEEYDQIQLRFCIHADGRDGNGTTVPTGIYFCKLRARSLTKVRKMILIR